MSTTEAEPLTISSRLVDRSPFFYGWIIVFVGTTGMVMTSPGQTYAVSIFIEYFIKDLGLSRSLVSTLYTVGTLVGSFAQPIIGRQIDKRGPRQMVLFISIIFGIASIFMGFVSNAVMLGLGFAAIRMFGQGGLGLVSGNVINQWWVRRRGAVMGFSGVLVSLLGLGTFPSVINWMIPVFGWRTTYILLGFSLLLFMAPLGYLLFRDKPEKFGQLPDGGVLNGSDNGSMTIVAEENWLLSQAIRTPAFWILATDLSAFAMLVTGLFFHMVDIFSSNGLAPAIAATVYLPLALTTAGVNLFSGVLISRVKVRYLLGVGLLMQAAALLMAQHLQSVQIAFLFGMIVGATMGLARTVGSVAWAMYFGRTHLGSITGITSTIMIAGSALGPLPLGLARDLLGGYNQALTILAIIPLALMVVTVLFAKRPKLQETVGQP